MRLSPCAVPAETRLLIMAESHGLGCVLIMVCSSSLAESFIEDAVYEARLAHWYWRSARHLKQGGDNLVD